MRKSGKISGGFMGKVIKVAVVSIIAIAVIFWGAMLLTNGGTLFREDEAKAACYALAAQKYPEAQVHSYETRSGGFGIVIVESDLTAPDPNQIIGQVDLHYECRVTFRTGFPQARLTSLEVKE